MSDETPTSRIQFGTRGQRSVRTSETVVILAGIQGPAGRDSTQATWRGAWEATTQYQTDDIVGWMGDAWISLIDGNIGQQPDLNPAAWDPLTQAAAERVVENGFDDTWDSTYNARQYTRILFSPERYDALGSIWIQARLTVELLTPGVPPDPVIVYAGGAEVLVGDAGATYIDLPLEAPSGLYWFYYDETGTIQYQVGGSLASIIERYALIAAVYYIGRTETIPDVDWTDGLAHLLSDERHGRVMDSRTHRYLHLTRGAAYQEGMTPLDVITEADGDTLTNNQIGMEDGVFWDEDLRHALVGSSKPYTAPIYYRDGAAGEWTVDHNTTNRMVFRRFSGGADRAAWNEDLGGGAWQLTEGGNNNFVLMHLFATNGRPVVGSSGYSDPEVYAFIMGQAEYMTVGDARDGAEVELRSLLFGGLEDLSPEFVPVATFIVQARGIDTYGGRLRATDNGDDFVDWRFTSSGAGGTGLAAHSTTHEDGGSDEIDVTALTGLLADPQTPLAHAPSHNAPGGADQLADYQLAGAFTDGEKGMVPKPFALEGNSQILHAKTGWALPNAPTKDVPILTRSDFIPTSLTDAVFSFLKGVNSIVDTPGADTELELVNDVAVPGPDQVYGTDGGGVKGWKADPGGGGSTFPVTSADIALERAAAHIARFISGLNPTELQVYNSDDGIGNYERGILRWYLGTQLWIGTDLPGGTGLARDLVLVYSGSPRLTVGNTLITSAVTLEAPRVQNLVGITLQLAGQVNIEFITNSQVVWTIDANGHLFPGAAVSGSADFGKIGLNVRDIYYARQLISQVATGTAPMTVASTTKVANLNVDQLDDKDGAYYATFEKSGVFLDINAARNVPVFVAPYACTVTAVKATRVGATQVTVNARKNGSLTHIAGGFIAGSAGAWASGGAVQNAGYSIGDRLELQVLTVTGGPATEVAVQVEFVKA